MSGRPIKELMRYVPVKAGTKPQRIARNTMIYTHKDGSARLRLHNTDIVTRRPDGVVVVNDGGYDTKTTKARVYDYSARVAGFRLTWWYADGVRYISAPAGAYPYVNDAIEIRDGVPVVTAEDHEAAQGIRENRKRYRRERAKVTRAARKEREHAARVARFGGLTWFAAYESALADAKQARRDSRRKRCTRKRR